MGRYYDGDIEGKFWFGTQSSDAAEQFGATEAPSSIINYYVDKDSFNTEHLLELIQRANVAYDAHITLMTDPEEIGSMPNVVLMADIQIGLKMYKHLFIDGNDSCSFQAEL